MDIFSTHGSLLLKRFFALARRVQGFGFHHIRIAVSFINSARYFGLCLLRKDYWSVGPARGPAMALTLRRADPGAKAPEMKQGTSPLALEQIHSRYLSPPGMNHARAILRHGRRGWRFATKRLDVPGGL